MQHKMLLNNQAAGIALDATSPCTILLQEASGLTLICADVAHSVCSRSSAEEGPKGISRKVTETETRIVAIATSKIPERLHTYLRMRADPYDRRTLAFLSGRAAASEVLDSDKNAVTVRLISLEGIPTRDARNRLNSEPMKSHASPKTDTLFDTPSLFSKSTVISPKGVSISSRQSCSPERMVTVRPEAFRLIS